MRFDDYAKPNHSYAFGIFKVQVLYAVLKIKSFIGTIFIHSKADTMRMLAYSSGQCVVDFELFS